MRIDDEWWTTKTWNIVDRYGVCQKAGNDDISMYNNHFDLRMLSDMKWIWLTCKCWYKITFRKKMEMFSFSNVLNIFEIHSTIMYKELTFLIKNKKLLICYKYHMNRWDICIMTPFWAGLLSSLLESDIIQSMVLDALDVDNLVFLRKSGRTKNKKKLYSW